MSFTLRQLVVWDLKKKNFLLQSETKFYFRLWTTRFSGHFFVWVLRRQDRYNNYCVAGQRLDEKQRRLAPKHDSLVTCFLRAIALARLMINYVFRCDFYILGGGDVCLTCTATVLNRNHESHPFNNDLRLNICQCSQVTRDIIKWEFALLRLQFHVLPCSTLSSFSEPASLCCDFVVSM